MQTSTLPRLSSIRSYLLLLVAAILLPMLALAAVLAWHYAAAARQTIAAERLDVANNLANLVDREIGTMAGFLSGLSISPGFRAGEEQALDVASRSARERGFEVIGVYRADGRLLFKSPSEGRLAMPAADRIGIAQATPDGGPIASDLQADAGPSPGLFFISVAVRGDGGERLVVSGGVSPRRLQSLFAEAGLREGWRAGVVDHSGFLLARSREPEIYVGRRAQQPMVDAASGTQTSGLFDVVSRDGVEVKNSFQRSMITGWTTGVAVPASVVNAPYWSTAFMLAAIAIGFTLLGLLLAALIASRITHGVYLLGRAVVAFVTGDSVPLPAETFFELRDVLRVIESAAAMGRKGAYIRR